MMRHLEALTNLCGVSGDEGRVRAYLKKEAMALASDISVDAMGNLYVHKPGPGRRVMLCAHMDEVGMIVTGIRDDGLLAYEACGLDPRVCVSKRVLVGKGAVPGVIGAKAIHLQSKEEFTKAIKHDKLYVDIGAKDKKDAEASVHVGDYICFNTEFAQLGELVSAKALDDRVGCAILLALMQNEYACDISYVFTVQEEVGCRGAMAAVHRVEPEIALVLEGTMANDLPEATDYVTRVGEGPAITFMDGGTVVKRNMFDALKAVAVEEGIPWQCRRGTAGGTDASAIHKALLGCLAGGISVPCRYIHSPLSVASAADIKNAYRLADAFLRNGLPML